jgi:hypothetical protein
VELGESRRQLSAVSKEIVGREAAPRRGPILLGATLTNVDVGSITSSKNTAKHKIVTKGFIG